MHTRSSPSLSVLHSLARTARLDTASFRRLSKPLLFQRLKESTNFDRLRRAQARSIKRQQQKQQQEEGEQETRTASSHASSSSSGGGSGRSRRRRSSTVRYQRHVNEKGEKEDDGEERVEVATAELAEASSNSSNSSKTSSDRSKVDATQAAPYSSSSAFSLSSFSSVSFSSSSSSSSSSYLPNHNVDANDGSGGGKMSPAEEAAWEALTASLPSSLPPSRPPSVDPILLTELNPSSFSSSLPSSYSSTSSSSAAATATTAITTAAAAAVGNGGGGDGPIFRFRRPNGSAVSYRVATLIDYLLATGKFEEPETRLPFTDTDLETLDRLGREGGLGRRSVWEAKYYEGGKYAEMKFRRDALMGLERCAGELVTEMLQLVEEEEDAEEGQMRLVLALFPLLSDLYRQMEEGGKEGGDDGEWAKQCLGHWQEFMRGPPNRRTRDRLGFLSIIMAFFAELQGGGRGGF